jgi:hypothetical protein
MIRVHKRNDRRTPPAVSVILVDWSCRERFDSLRWLNQQTVPRDQYELIWVELYDRVAPESLDLADTVLTCGQRGLYHKHAGYNAGLLHARGEIITISDSDAIYPPEFIASILTHFQQSPGVLMHYQWRTDQPAPAELRDLVQLKDFTWKPLWPNVGACMSVRKTDAIRFGGFDEHRSLRGYVCGPYELGWRLVNAGVPEIWHDPRVALWHFAHPHPDAGLRRFSWRRWREIAHPHVEFHALTAVEAFNTGRLLPLRENPAIRQLRLNQRHIGTDFEKRLATLAGPKGFSGRTRLARRLGFWLFTDLWGKLGRAVRRRWPRR